MQDGEIQRELLEKTRSATKALEVAINIEMGIQNQLKMSGTAAYAVSNQVANTSINSIQKSWSRRRSTSNNFVKPTVCPNCGYAWSASHRQNCPACGKNCKNCGINNHFRKSLTIIPIKPKPRVNDVDDTYSEAATISTSATVGEQVNQIEAMMHKHRICDANYDHDYDDFDDNCVAIISDSDNVREVEPVNIHI